ncbi:hypothetical protein B0H11DRAFT_2059721, partial [Mycena galericulata]
HFFCSLANDAMARRGRDESHSSHDRIQITRQADTKERLTAAEEDARNAAIIHAMRLILGVRAQRPVPCRATPSALISLPDLAPLVAHNPALAHRPFVALHSSSSTSASSSGPYSSSSSSSCASPYSSSANVHTTSTPPPYCTHTHRPRLPRRARGPPHQLRSTEIPNMDREALR